MRNRQTQFPAKLLPPISLFNIIHILYFVLGAASLASKFTFEYTSPVLLHTYIIIVSDIKEIIEQSSNLWTETVSNRLNLIYISMKSG